MARHHILDLADIMESALANEREVDPRLCPVCFLVFPYELKGDAPELPMLKTERPGLWDACMRQLTSPRTIEACTLRREALQRNIDTCPLHSTHQSALGLRPGHNLVDPLEILDYLLCLCLWICIWGIDSSTGGTVTVIGRSHEPAKRFASSGGSWPTRVDQLFPYGVDRTVDALVTACCSFIDNGPWWVLTAILNLARPKVGDVFLREENHTRFVQALLALTLCGTGYTIHVPHGGQPNAYSLWLREGVAARQIALGVFETILRGSYARPDDDIRFMHAHEAQFSQLYDVAQTLAHTNPADEGWCAVAQYVACSSSYRRTSCMFIPDADALRFVETHPRHSIVVRAIDNTLHGLAGEKNCAASGCTRTMLDSPDNYDGRRALSLCARCKITRYCSKACQRRDWSDGQPFAHKQLCPIFLALARCCDSSAMAKLNCDRHIEAGNVADEELRLAASWMLSRSQKNMDLIRAHLMSEGPLSALSSYVDRAQYLTA